MPSMCALFRIELLRQLLRPRWRVAFLFLVAVGFIWTDRLTYELHRHGISRFNFLDLPVSILSDLFATTWIFYLTFIWLISDLIVRDFEEGTAAVMVLRTRSFARIWLAKAAALGGLAVVFSVGGTIAVLIGTALRGTPLSWADSAAAQACFARGGAFPRPAGLPMVALVPLLSLYVGYTLWVATIVPICLTLRWRRSFVPLIAALTWILGSLTLNPGMFARSAWIGLLDVRYFLSYTKSFATGIFLHTVPIWAFLAIGSICLTLTIIAGLIFTRKLEL